MVARQAPVAADPGQRPFHDPALRQHHEAVQIRALHDLRRPRAGACDQRGHPRSLVAALANDALDQWEACTPGAAAARLRRGPARWRRARPRSAAGQACRPGRGACARAPSCPRHARWDQASAPFYGALGALRVDEGRGRAGLPSCLLAAVDVERVVDAPDRAVPLPRIQVVPHRAARTQVRRSAFHWQPVESTQKTAFSTSRTFTVRGRPSGWALMPMSEGSDLFAAGWPWIEGNGARTSRA